MSRYRRQALRRPPSQSWRTFLRNHASSIWAADLFTVQTLAFRTLYVLIVIDHDRRRIRHWNVTEHPNAPWIWQQMIEATAWGDFSSSSIRAANCQACIREFELLGPVWAAIGDYHKAVERDRPVLPAREALEATIWVYAHALAKYKND